MAFIRRRRFTRRRIGSRSGRVARQQGYRTYSSRVGSGFVQPRVVRTPRIERAKFLDLDYTSAAANNYYQNWPMLASRVDSPLVESAQGNAQMRCINLVINGSGNNDRVSGRILMHSVLLKGSIFYQPIVSSNTSAHLPAGGYVPTGVGDASTRPIQVQDVDRSVSIFLVYYPRTRFTSTPSWTGLLETPIRTDSMLDETNVSGARVLLRKNMRLSLNSESNGEYSIGRNSRRDFAWKLNLNLPTEWNNNTPQSAPKIENVRSGHLFLMFMSNVASVSSILNPNDPRAALHPQLSCRIRLAFSDA